MLTCLDIAKYFIKLANDTGSFISNQKLQKLVYYAQAWHLAIHDSPLFDEDFEAWVHGPVIPTMYQKYKIFGWKPILEDVSEPEIPEQTIKFLDEVAQEYFACDAYELERMTHIEAPWIEALKGQPVDAPCNEIISKESMKRYYSSRVEEKT